MTHDEYLDLRAEYAPEIHELRILRRQREEGITICEVCERESEESVCEDCKSLEYRDYVIEKVSPVCGYNYEFYHREYDGPEDRRAGIGKTLEECYESIDIIEGD